MPYTIHIDHDKKLVIVVGRDPLTIDDALMVLDWQMGGRAWSYGTLHDAREASWVPSDDDRRAIAAYVDANAGTLGPRGPVAFVAAPAAVFELARTYSSAAAASAPHAGMFRDVGAAKRWLDRYSPDRGRRAASRLVVHAAARSEAMVNAKDIPDGIAGPPCSSCGTERTVRISSRFGRETSFCIHCGASSEYDSGAPARQGAADDRRTGADRRHDGFPGGAKDGDD